MRLSDNVPGQAEGFSFAAVNMLVDSIVKPRGFVEINIWRGAIGEYLERQVMAGFTPLSENLVVNLARQIMSRMLPGAVQDPTPADPTITLYDTTHPSYPLATITNVSELFITKMMWGTGGDEPLTPTIPIPPTVDDEQLAEPLTSPPYKTAVVDYPTATSVRFTASLLQSEANGEGISEVGLFTDQFDLLFARKTFGVLTKSSDFSFEFRYSVVF